MKLSLFFIKIGSNVEHLDLEVEKFMLLSFESLEIIKFLQLLIANPYIQWSS